MGFGVCQVSLSHTHKHTHTHTHTHTHILTVSPLSLRSKFMWFVLAYANQEGSSITNPQRWGCPPSSQFIQPEHSDDQPSHQPDSCQREPNTSGSGHIKASRCVFLVVWWYDQIRHLFFPQATPRPFPDSEWRCRRGGWGEWCVCVCGGGGWNRLIQAEQTEMPLRNPPNRTDKGSLSLKWMCTVVVTAHSSSALFLDLDKFAIRTFKFEFWLFLLLIIKCVAWTIESCQASNVYLSTDQAFRGIFLSKLC